MGSPGTLRWMSALGRRSAKSEGFSTAVVSSDFHVFRCAEYAQVVGVFGYLRNSIPAVLAIAALLIVQAFADLSLPALTSDIIDVGIQQSGIEDASPTEMRDSTRSFVTMLASEDDEALIESSYDETDAGTWELNACGRAYRADLDDALSLPLLVVSMAEDGSVVGLAHPGKPIGVEPRDGAVFGHRDDEQRKAQGVVEIGAVRAAVRVKFPGSCIGFVIRGFNQGFIVLACEHRGETAGRIAHLGRARVLDAGLLDADVDDVRRQSRQGQIGERLHDEQRGDGEHGRNRMPQIAEYAHMTSFPCAHAMFPAHAPCRHAVGIDAAAHAPF